MVFLGPDGRLSRLEAGLLPAPFHLAGSFLRARYLSLSDKLRVAYGLARLRWMPGDGERPGESFADWLLRHGQTVRTMNRYWATVLVSALNERLEQMDVGHARKVFLDGFLRNRDGFQMEIPLVPLGELYGTRLETWLARPRRRGPADDRRPQHRARCAKGVALRSGERIAADFVVLAVPFDRVRGLMPGALVARIPGLAGLDALRASPITGVHLWFDRPVCPLDHVVTVGRLIQWVFNHTAIQGRAVPAVAQRRREPGPVSATGHQRGLRPAAARQGGHPGRRAGGAGRDLARSALRAVAPLVGRHRARSDLRRPPGSRRPSPPQRTPVAGLFLAGDWTATGWPATMEGAVRSGYLAAEGILQDLGRPESLVRPGLANHAAGALAARAVAGRRGVVTNSARRRYPDNAKDGKVCPLIGAFPVEVRQRGPRTPSGMVECEDGEGSRGVRHEFADVGVGVALLVQ